MRHHVVPRVTVSRRRKRCSQLHKQQLRPLAPKGKALPSHPEAPVLQSEHNSIWSEQDTEAPATQSYIPLKPVSSDHDFTPSPLLPPNFTVASLERNQYVTPNTNIYFNNRLPLTLDDDGFPEFAPGNLFSDVVTHDSHGLSTHNVPYSNLQLQETIQNRQDQDFWMPGLHVAEGAVWTDMAQPTICAYKDQSSQPIVDRPPVSIQQLPPVQPTYHTSLAYHAPLQRNWQHAACVNCPSIWRSHIECIMFSDLGDKGVSNLKCNYGDLQQHIHEAHRWEYGVACTLCEHLFCYHVETMMLLEGTDGDLSRVRIDLRSSCKALRDHIKEAHGGC